MKVAKEQSEGLNSPGMSIIRQGQIFYAQDDKYKNNDYLNQKLGIRLYPFSLAEIKIQRRQASERKITFADIQLSKALLDRYELDLKDLSFLLFLHI